MKGKRHYPYIVARDRNNKNQRRFEFYLTIKPEKRVYLQSMSWDGLIKSKKITATKDYIRNISFLENGDIRKPKLAKNFYKEVFGENTIATKIR